MRLIARARSATRCQRCGDPIPAATPCFEDTISLKDRARRKQHFHPECALDVDTFTTGLALREERDLPSSLVALRELAIDRNAAIDRRIAGAWTHRYEAEAAMPGYVVIEPRGPRDDDPRWVRPAHDPSGRPRVRVLCAGSAFSVTRATGKKLEELLRAQGWASPRREYVFQTGLFDLEQLDNDPAQPIVATLYAAIATRSAIIEGERELCAMRDLGLPPPVLWLVGVSSTEPRDEHTMRFRAVLDRCGYDPDTSPVLCAPKITEAALDRLVAVFDEHADGAEWRIAGASWRLIARSILDDVRGHYVERYTEQQLSLRLDQLWSIADPQTNALLIEAATLLLDRGELTPAAMLIERPARCEAALALRWVRAALENDREILSTRLSTMLSILEREQPGGASSMLLDAIVRSKDTDRTSALLNVLVWQAERSDLEKLEAWIAAGLDAPIESLALDTISAIRNRFEMEDSMRW